MRVTTVLLPILLLPIACASGGDESTKSQKLANALDTVTVTLSDAIDTATVAYPGTTVREADLNADDVAYEVVLIDGETISSVVIDPVSGDIIDVQAVHASVPTLCGLDVALSEAIANAEAVAGNGTAVEIETLAGADNALEGEAPACEVDVVVYKDGELVEVELAADGSVVATNGYVDDDDPGEAIACEINADCDVDESCVGGFCEE